MRDLVPFGLAYPNKPRHFREMARAAWENRDHLGYAWRILNHGVCDGCSLGPYGLKDNVISGVHLCMTRLNLLRLNTMPAAPDAALADIDVLRSMSNEELHKLGRLAYPMVLRRGDRGFRRVTWDQAMDVIAGELHGIPPERMGFFATSRGLTNEAYYTFQKLPRLLGTNNVDLCARLCHAASVYGLKQTLGVGAPTCSLSDFIGAELLILFGTDLANNQPVTTKYMHYARKQGTRIMVVNPYREPGLERYWIPSVASSALFGSRLMDDFFQVRVGGDIAFLNGVMKVIVEQGMENREFIARQTCGFEELAAHLRALSWPAIEEGSGIARPEIERFARMYGQAKTAVLCYSMGLTQHRFGVENVKAIADLALIRGNLGREKCGIMPIRGHSGVQGGGECGVDPDKFPGGFEVNAENARRFSELWQAPVPASTGLKTGQMIEAAHAGQLDALYTIGGNLLETMQDRYFVMEALRRVRVRIHQDIVLNTYSTFEGGEVLVVLPAQTRYESGGTSTSTERRIRYSPPIRGPRMGEARPEWEIPCLIARRLMPQRAAQFAYATDADVRREMAAAMPIYAGIEKLSNEGDWVQWGGPQLFTEGFQKMPGGRARFVPVSIPEVGVPPGKFYVTTRRGRQFNSMTFGPSDPLTGGQRDDIFINPRDAARLGINEGDIILLRSNTGEFAGNARFADIREGNLQAYWPECNVLIERRYDPVSSEPDYNAVVDVIPIAATKPAQRAG
ncbi:MAG TPA: FdhF/YdeP family oxidoreductase [Terriglobales bacterium]|nr:FdhF/YdeP family oxidoreductase [Terriglobales bacterium]